MKRTFIAVNVPVEKTLGNLLDSMKNDLQGERIKWEDLSRLHITLAFIGETSEGTIKDIEKLLSVICEKTSSIEISVKGLGLFKSLHDPRVIWAGIEDNNSLSVLQARIISGLDSLGVMTEDRPFRPHLTLGRIRSVKRKDILEKILVTGANTQFQRNKLTELVYYESVLRQEGSLYIPIKRLILGG
ncbi:MAG: RNA 2',3'-cyclic phosphodiesterase [Bacteroidales bacterium]